MTGLTILFSGLILLLLFVSITGRVLDKRRPGPAVDNLIARVNAWWVMILALAIAFMLGRTAVFPPHPVFLGDQPVSRRPLKSRAAKRAQAAVQAPPTTGAGLKAKPPLRTTNEASP